MKRLIKGTLIVISSIIAVIGILYTLHHIPVNQTSSSTEASFYLSDNGDHIDIILDEEGIYKAYGWGSKIFFTKVKTWDDLTFGIACQALFTKPESLVREIHYNNVQSDWVKVNCSKEQLKKIKKSIKDSFKDGIKKPIICKNYPNCYFYEGEGNYCVFKTCNTWVNSILKDAGLRCCAYTVTSSALMDKYK